MSFANAKHVVVEGETASITVNISPVRSTPTRLTLSYRQGPGRIHTVAIAGRDYYTFPFSVTIPAGDASKTFSVTTLQDQIREGNETFRITLRSAGGATLGSPAETSVTILDDDSTPVASFAAATARVAEEAGVSNVRVNLSLAPAADLTLNYTVGGTARRGAGETNDYTIANLGTVAVAAGATSVNIPVRLNDNAWWEHDGKTVVLTLAAGSGYTVGGTATHTLTITDPADPPMVRRTTETSFSVSSTNFVEGSARNYGISMPRGLRAGESATFPVTFGGAATRGTDYTVSCLNNPPVKLAKLTCNNLNAGVASVTLTGPSEYNPVILTITAQTDSNSEPGGETLTVRIGEPRGWAFGGFRDNREESLTLFDPPSSVTVKLSFNSFGIDENDSDGTLQPVVIVSPDTGAGRDLVIPLVTTGVTATVGTDFTALTSVTIPAGRSRATFHVPITNDEVFEPDETFTLAIDTNNLPAGVTAGSVTTATATIRNDDPLPAATFATPSGNAAEDAGVAVNVAVNLDRPSHQATTLSYTVGGTATPGSGNDFTIANSGTVAVPAGATEAAIPVTLIDDDLDEPDKTVVLTLTAGTGYTVGAANVHTLTITDDEATPRASFATAARRVAEDAGTHDVTVNISPPPGRALTLGYTVGGTATPGSGNDFTIASSGTVAVPKGSASVTIPVTLIDNDDDEADKTVVLTLSAGSGYAVGATGVHTLTIADDEVTKPTITVSGGPAVTEGQQAVFTFHADGKLAADVQIHFITGNSDPDIDYLTSSYRNRPHSQVMPAGASTVTWNLPTHNDNWDEADSYVFLGVVADDAYQRGSPHSARVAARDNDGPPTAAFASGAQSVAESAGTRNVRVNISPARAAAFTLSYTVGGTASAGTDFTIAGSGSIAVPANATTVDIPVVIIDDSASEGAETVVLTLTAGAGYTVGGTAAHTLTITASDRATPEATFAAPAQNAGENAGTRNVAVTISPAPTSAFTLRYTVGGSATPGSGNDFTIANSGSVSVSSGATGVNIPVAINDDDADEPVETVVLTLTTGTGYTVGSSARVHTLTIADNDAPLPVVTIAADAAAVTEGDVATFTLTMDPAPAGDVAVNVSVENSGFSDFLAAGQAGARTVTIGTGGSARLSVATENDTVEERDGRFSAWLTRGNGYRVGRPALGSVLVRDNDEVQITGTVHVSDVTVPEASARACVMVELRGETKGESALVKLETRDGTAVRTEGDYFGQQKAYFLGGSAPATREFCVHVRDDAHNEGNEYFEVHVTQAVLVHSRVALGGDHVGRVTIENDDPMPAAWLSRFGRTVAEQALDGIAGRMAAPRNPGAEGAIAGQALVFDPGASGGDAGDTPVDRDAALAMAGIARGFGGEAGGPGDTAFGGNDGFGNDGPAGQSRTMTAREALLGSSFTLTGEADGAGGSMAFWGRGSHAHFDGREGSFSLDGEATTAMLGADYARGGWLVGLALTQSAGKGGYADAGGGTVLRPASQDCSDDMDAVLCEDAVHEGDGKVEASLTAAIPYASLQASERLELWGAAGYGSGEVTLETEMGRSYKADTEWTMAAAGLRGDLLSPPAEGSGPALAVTSDALWASTSSEKTSQLAASDSDVTRLRLGLEGSYRIATQGGGQVTPKLELGARHDGGDAETGFGVELGGGLAWVDPGLGLSLDLSGRTLIAHGDDDLKDRGFAAALSFDPAPATGRGLSMSLRQEFGTQAEGGLDALFARGPLEDRTGIGEATSRWTMEAAYGLPILGGRFTGSPHAGLGLSTGARDYSVGWRVEPAAGGPDLSFGVKATRRESDAAAPEHAVGVEATVRW